jgi:hypothetical protein
MPRVNDRRVPSGSLSLLLSITAFNAAADLGALAHYRDAGNLVNCNEAPRRFLAGQEAGKYVRGEKRHSIPVASRSDGLQARSIIFSAAVTQQQQMRRNFVAVIDLDWSVSGNRGAKNDHRSR